MEYASFYGGRRGHSFVIVKNYPDIPSMVSDFTSGGSFTEVNFDEYVIINTVSKNHPDNGKIFSIENYNIKEEKDLNKNNGKTVMLFYEAA